MSLRRSLTALAILASAFLLTPLLRADDVLDEAREQENRGLEAESRGRPDDAYDRYSDALQTVARAMDRASAEQRPLLSMRGEIYLHRLYEFAQETERYGELDRLLAGLPSASIDDSLKTWIHWYRAHSSLRTGAIARGDAEFKALGFITDWLLCGPFGNDNGTAGWSTEFGPEKETALDAQFDGVKRKVGWRAVPVTGHSGYTDLNSLLTPNDDAIAYALCYVKSPKAQAAALRIASDEGCRVWLNGVQVHANEAMRSASLDQDIVGVNLVEGWNRLLLRISEADGPWGFRCRLTTPEGASLALETLGHALLVKNAAGEFKTPVPTVAKASEAEAPAVNRGARDVLATLLDADVKNGYERFHEAYLKATLGAEDKNKHADRDAAERAAFLDETPNTLYLVARLSEIEAQMDAERQEHRKRSALERTLKSDPSHALAMLDLADYYLNSEQNVPKALDLVDRALAVNPDFLEARFLRNEILDRKGFSIEAYLQRKSLLDAAKKTGRVLAIGADLASQDHDLKTVVRLHLQALERDFANGSARSELIDTLLRLGEFDGALQECKTTLALNPFSVDAHLRMAHIQEARQKYPEAIAACRAALELAPENDDILAALGTYQHLSGDRSGALETWKEALTLNPNNVWLRRYIEFVKEGEKPWEAAYRRDAKEIIPEAKTTLDTSAASAVRLLDFEVNRVRKDGTRSAYAHQITKVLTDKGAKDLDRFTLWYTVGEERVKVLTARVIHPDGSVDEARINSGGDAPGNDLPSRNRELVDLPPISPGDVVDLEWRKDDLTQSFFKDYYGRNVFFGDIVPTVESSFVLIGPAERSFYFRTRNLKVEPSTRDLPDTKEREWVWKVKDLPAVEAEPLMPPPDEVYPTLRISTFKDWAELARWYWSLVKNQTDLTEEMRAEVLKLTRDKETEEEKIRAIYDFVVGKIRYNAWEFGIHGYKPYRTSAIFENHFGDCKDKALLLHVLLQEIGITAHPVLINAQERRGNEDHDLPMFEYFNHCIACVEKRGEPLRFVDGTATFWPLGDLPDMDLGAQVLVVRPDGGTMEEIPLNTAHENRRTEETLITLDKDGNALAATSGKVIGTRAADIRAGFAVADQRKLLIERNYGRRFAGATVGEVAFSELQDLAVPVSYEYSVRLPKFAAVEGNTWKIRAVLFPTSMGNLVTMTDRKYDLVLNVPRTDAETVLIKIPKGWKVQSVPENQEIESPLGSFKLTYELQGDVIRVTHSTELRVRRVPTSEYGKYREFCTSVDQWEEKDVVLVKE